MSALQDLELKLHTLLDFVFVFVRTFHIYIYREREIEREILVALGS